MAESAYMRAMLFDFYGELLTDKQREYFDLHCNEDFSLGEIAEQTGISRQGVWDIIRRAEVTMADMEKKTGLIKRFTEMTDAAAGIRKDLDALRETATDRQADIINGMELKLDVFREQDGGFCRDET